MRYGIFLSQLHLTAGQWIAYWDMTRVYLVEKSPQSMLKSALYRDLFKYAKSIKFLILIKVSFSTLTFFLIRVNILFVSILSLST